LLTLGVDAARRGWVAIALRDGRFEDCAWKPEFQALLESYPDAVVVGVDVPIGLPDAGVRRRADSVARRFVGARRSSVFFTPPRAVVEAAGYTEARALEPSTSAQSFALSRAILDVDRARDERVREVHPEVSFAVLAGEPLKAPKRSWNGQQERLRLLDAAGIRIPEELDGVPGTVPADDIVDAAVVAWSAMRIARREHVTFPADAVPGEPVIAA
jgi:predicted RNase H-like nuclease